MKLEHPPLEPQENQFDLRARAELALAYEPGQPPAHLFRAERGSWLSRRRVQRSIGALLLLGTGVGGVLAMRPCAATSWKAASCLIKLGLNNTRRCPGRRS